MFAPFKTVFPFPYFQRAATFWLEEPTNPTGLSGCVVGHRKKMRSVSLLRAQKRLSGKG